MSIDYSVLPLSKGTKRKTLKARQARAEKKVEKGVREKCVERDGRCRFANGGHHIKDQWVFHRGDSMVLGLGMDLHGTMCQGVGQLCHMHARRRSKTRGMDPTYRHDTRFCFMGCGVHHPLYDSKQIVVTALTRKGADGPLKFRRAK